MVIIPAANYSKASKLLKNGEFVSAAQEFTELGDYKDASEQVLVCNYKEAERLESSGRKAAAAMTFGALGDYSDARKRSFALWDNIAFRETLSVGSLEAAVIKEDGSVSYFHDKGRYIIEDNLGNYGTDVVDIELMKYAPIIALKSDGTLLDKDGVYNDDWTDIVAIDSDNHSLAALKSDGTVLYDKYYDASDFGQDNVSEWRNIVAIECTSKHTVGLRSNGTVIATGSNKDGECNVDFWTDIVAISANYGITVGLKADGTVVTTDPEKNVSGWSDVEYIYATQDCVIGIKSDGSVLHVGENSHNGCTTWKNISVIKCPSYGKVSSIGINNNGDLVFDPQLMKVYKIGILDSDSIKDWTDIKQPNVKGFYDLDHEITVDNEAEQNLDGLDNYTRFSNKFGTPSTICAHSGCSAFIASSGDTNCCKIHSNRCGNCNCYIDEDAMYCMSCLEDALT